MNFCQIQMAFAVCTLPLFVCDRGSVLLVRPALTNTVSGHHFHCGVIESLPSLYGFLINTVSKQSFILDIFNFRIVLNSNLSNIIYFSNSEFWYFLKLALFGEIFSSDVGHWQDTLSHRLTRGKLTLIVICWHIWFSVGKVISAFLSYKFSVYP